MKKLFLLATVLGLCLFVAMPGQAVAAKAWKLSHHRPVDSPIDKDLKKFAADVAVATEGRITIDVFPAGQLGSSEVVMERVGIGAVEMFLGFPSAALDVRLDLTTMPALATSYGELEKLFRQGSPFMDLIEEVFAGVDIHTLASYAVGFCGIGFKTPVDGMLDPQAAHKEKVRSATLNSFRYSAEALGYLATPIPMSDLFTALQTGIVDGSYGNGPEVVYLQFRDMIKHFVPIKAQADVFFLGINAELFDGLNAKDKDALAAVAKQFEKDRFAAAMQEEGLWEKRLEESGTKVYHLSPEKLAAFHKKIQDYAWPKMKKDLGDKFFNVAMKARDEALKQ